VGTAPNANPPFADREDLVVCDLYKSGKRPDFPHEFPLPYRQLISMTWLHEAKQRPSPERIAAFIVQTGLGEKLTV
jgi:hypothetical protein